MPDDDTKFPYVIEIANINRELLSQLGRTFPREEWAEVAEYKLVRVRRVRWTPQWEDR